ncbi:Hypothetical protein A7982_02107 [Minicystis rosea]|nr:Hypothetical protein A7982_02107 [Minicystis rosea]
MIYHFLAGAMAYGVAAAIVYIPTVKTGPYFFPIGLLCALLGNVVWLHLVRHVDSGEQILVDGFWWDGMVVAASTLIPILCFGIRLRATVGLGMLLMVLGMMLTKV